MNVETENNTPKSLCKVLALYSRKHSSLDLGMVPCLFLQKRAQIRLISDTFSIISSYIQHVSPCLIFTEAKLKKKNQWHQTIFLIAVTNVATIGSLASWSNFPPLCAHKMQTLIILKTTNVIRCPSNGITLSAGWLHEGFWACFPQISLQILPCERWSTAGR